MTTIALFDAKKRLCELIDWVPAGEEFVITRRGKAVARLGMPESGTSRQRALDAIAGLHASRKGVRLGRLGSRALTTQGRR